MKCFFCRAEAGRPLTSQLDKPPEIPDMLRISCPNRQCRLRYHFDGSLPVKDPDLRLCEETRNRIKKANGEGLQYVTLSLATDGVERVVVKECPIPRPIATIVLHTRAVLRSEDIDHADFRKEGSDLGRGPKGDVLSKRQQDELTIVMKDASDKKDLIVGKEAWGIAKDIEEAEIRVTWG